MRQVVVSGQERSYRPHITTHYDGTRALPVFAHVQREYVVFVEAFMGQLSRDVLVDSTRAYAAGYSNGATLSYVCACTIRACDKKYYTCAGTSEVLFYTIVGRYVDDPGAGVGFSSVPSKDMIATDRSSDFFCDTDYRDKIQTGARRYRGQSCSA
jgi:hypothetical protein